MYVNNAVICACSAYEGKYYFNESFYNIPESVKEELKIMCVMYTEDGGGELIISFSKDGRLLLNVKADEGDLLFDEIGSALKIKQMQNEKRELFTMLENYYDAFIK